MQSRNDKPSLAEGTGGTPIWVWVVYALGILAASILVLSVLFTVGAYLLSDDWGGLTLLAGGLWVYRRRR